MIIILNFIKRLWRLLIKIFGMQRHAALPCDFQRLPVEGVYPRIMLLDIQTYLLYSLFDY